MSQVSTLPVRSFLARWASLAATCLSLTAWATDEDVPALVRRLQTEKPAFVKRQQILLAARYDLADRAAQGTVMSRGKPVQGGVRVKLPAGLTWEQLAAMTSEEVKAK